MKIPSKKIKSRDKKLLEFCIWKKVLHIWACDSPFTKEKFNGECGPFLYREIDTICKHQLGIDLDQESVDFLNSHRDELSNSEARCMDMNTFGELDYEPDIIIFGEVIEHLMNLETALTNLKKVMKKDTLLIISTPNSYCFEGIIGNIFWRESFHEDHKVYFSYGMLTNLLRHNKIQVVDAYFCKIGHEPDNTKRVLLSIFGDFFVYYLFPRFYNNLLFVAKLDESTRL